MKDAGHQLECLNKDCPDSAGTFEYNEHYKKAFKEAITDIEFRSPFSPSINYLLYSLNL